MATEKKTVPHSQMTDGKRSIVRQLIQEYDLHTAMDIQNALKDLLGSTIKEMLEAEMDNHLGYSKSERSDNSNSRNGYKTKKVRSSMGELSIEVPQDRGGKSLSARTRGTVPPALENILSVSSLCCQLPLLIPLTSPATVTAISLLSYNYMA